MKVHRSWSKIRGFCLSIQGYGYALLTLQQKSRHFSNQFSVVIQLIQQTHKYNSVVCCIILADTVPNIKTVNFSSFSSWPMTEVVPSFPCREPTATHSQPSPPWSALQEYRRQRDPYDQNRPQALRHFPSKTTHIIVTNIIKTITTITIIMKTLWNKGSRYNTDLVQWETSHRSPENWETHQHFSTMTGCCIIVEFQEMK